MENKTNKENDKTNRYNHNYKLIWINKVLIVDIIWDNSLLY